MKRIFTLIALISLAFLYVNAQTWTWIKQFSSTGNVTPVDIVYGNDHNIYVAGLYTQALTIGTTTLPYSGPDPREDIFLCSFTSDGTFRWARQIGGNHIDDVGGIAVDNNNNIYIAGGYRSTILSFPPSSTTLSNVNLYDAFLAKYDNNGNLIFANRTFWGTDVQRIKDVVVDFTKNRLALVGFFKVQLIYFDGSVDQTIPTIYPKEHFIALYDLDGNFINIETIKGSQESTVFKTVNNCVYGGSVQGYFMTGDLIGKLYLPGNDTLKGDEVRMDAMVVRYDANLNYLWSRRGGGTNYEHVNSAARDDNGNIYIAGKCQSDPVTFDSTKTLLSAPFDCFDIDYYLAKYNRNGYLQWIRHKGGAGNDNAYGLAIKNYRVVTAGNIADGTNINTGFDLYNVNGNFIAGDVITGDDEDQGQGVAFNSNADSIFLTGYFKSTVLNAGPLTLTNAVAGLQDGFFVKYGYKFKIFLEEKTNITCNGSNNGYIKVGTQFGVNPITYSWTPNVSNTFEASNLAADTFRIIASDGSGQKDTIVEIIRQPAPITINASLLKDVTCYGGEDGEIQVTVTGGTTPYTLTWSGPDNLIQNNTSQTGLLSGSYKLVVVDASGCMTEKVFIINQPPKITFGGSSVVGITVPPSCNGAVNLTVTGGTPNFTYDWSGPSGYSSTNGTITNLCLKGDYDLEVTDSKLCVRDTTFYVPVDTGLNVAICAEKDISCEGESDGYAKVCVTQGGTGNYTYAWRTSGGLPVGGNDPELVDVESGTYYVRVTDNGNLKWAETSVNIEDPVNPLTLSFNTVRDISCFGRNDGFIDLTPFGGWGGYTYFWLPRGDTTQDVSNLIPGVWIVFVTDASGCSKQLQDTIKEPTEVIVDSIEVANPISCNGDADGILCAYVSGGTWPYTYLWNDDGSQNDACATDLNDRTYLVKVTDFRGCKAEGSKSLVEPDVLIVNSSKSDVKCKGGNDGSITLTPAGGTPPYTYAWDDGPFTKDRTDLQAGTYCVTVSDYHGCTPVYICIDINEPALSVSIDSVKITDVSCNGGSDGTITVYASGGTGILTFTISPGGTSNITGIFENLSAGDYVVEVHDVNLCSVTTGTLTVHQPTPMILNVTITDSVNCFGGSDGAITTNITGGIQPYVCLWEDGPTTCNRTDLPAGSFKLTVTDDNGCIKDTTFIIYQPGVLNINSVDTSWNSTSGGTITVSASGGTNPLTYGLIGVTNEGDSDSNLTGVFIDLSGGEYKVYVVDNNLCTDTADKTEFPELCCLSVEPLLDNSGISLYPNPTTGKLTVEIEAKDHKDINLEIVNLLGQVIWKKELQYNGQPRFIEVIDMSQQSRGTYFMRVNGLPVHTKILLE